MGVIESLLKPPPESESQSESVGRLVLQDALKHGWTLEQRGDYMELVPPQGLLRETTWAQVHYGADTVRMPACVYDQAVRHGETNDVFIQKETVTQ